MQEYQLKSGGAKTQAQEVSLLSHELRGDLNSILLALQALRLELSNVPNVQESLAELDRLRQTVLDTVEKIDALGHGKNPSASRRP